MVKLPQLVHFLNNYLAIDDIKDDSWNGLQIEGRTDVNHIATAVDARIATFEKAIAAHADFLLVHHGIFWKSSNPSYTKWIKRQIEPLRKNNISLYASHLPLDRHKDVGNNTQLLKLLGATVTKSFFEHDGKDVGWIGELKKQTSLSTIEGVLRAKLNASCVTLPFGKKAIRTIAVCTGGGGYPGFFAALNKNVDLYITGDAIHAPVAQDAGFNAIFAGHYATEILGVKALAQVLTKKFSVKTTFIDLPTGL